MPPKKKPAPKLISVAKCRAKAREFAATLTFAQRMAASNARMRTGEDLASSRVRMIPTIMPGLNRAAVGSSSKLVNSAGWPMGTTGIVSGAERSGKSVLLAALAISFGDAGGTTAYYDIEKTTQLEWFFTLGVDPSKFLYSGRFPMDERKKQGDDEEAIRELYYEQVIVEVDQLLAGYQEEWTKGRKPGPLLIVIDSLTKLIPRSVAVALRAAKGDMRKGTLGMTQAGFNTVWCADLGLRIADWDVAVIYVCHEVEKQQETRHFGDKSPKTKVKGGAGIRFEANLMMKTSFAGRVFDLAQPKKDPGSSEYVRDDRPVVGKKHRTWFEKSKIGPQNFDSFEWFVSTGTGKARLGFDRPREIVNEAMRRGILSIEDGGGISAKRSWEKGELTLGKRFEMEDGRSFTLRSLYDEEGGPTEMVAELGALMGV